jgi:Domain of unknown function (DUF4304)
VVAADIVQLTLGGFCESAGLRQRGSAWSRRREDLIHVVELQKSGQGRRYRVEIGIWLLTLGETSSPRTATCHVQTGLEAQMPEESRTHLQQLLDLEVSIAKHERRHELTMLLDDHLAPVLDSITSAAELRTPHGARFLRAARVGPQARAIIGRR